MNEHMIAFIDYFKGYGYVLETEVSSLRTSSFQKSVVNFFAEEDIRCIVLGMDFGSEGHMYYGYNPDVVSKEFVEKKLIAAMSKKKRD
ncbi:hypothetical protein [Bacillus sp. S0628]|uniref:hypothetical protein n=1 Tax=Bacillus sp. S0628 TaxID=2957802 RepID=UPI0020A022BC|nr:hypothetical protein [Bacillus sp. S0628]MCP1322060.1 hypothetical protein [Bacillus sp. S0628]